MTHATTDAVQLGGGKVGGVFADDLFLESIRDRGGGTRLPRSLLGEDARKEKSRAVTCISFFMRIATTEEKDLLQTSQDSGERRKVVAKLHDLLVRCFKDAYNNNMRELRLQQITRKVPPTLMAHEPRLKVNALNKPLSKLEKVLQRKDIAVKADETLMEWRKAHESGARAIRATEEGSDPPSKRVKGCDGGEGDGSTGGVWLGFFFAKIIRHRLTRALSYSCVTFDGEYTKYDRGVSSITCSLAPARVLR